VAIDGVSLAANYRAQFSRVLNATSYQGLIRQMRAKVSDVPAAPVVAAAVDGEAPIVPVEPASPVADARLIPGPWPDAAGQEGPEPRRSLKLEVTLIARAEVEPTIAAKTAGTGAAEEVTLAAAAPSQAGSQPASPPGARAPQSDGTGPAGSRAYWVQVGAFKSVETAWRLAASLVEQEPRSATPSGVAVEPVASRAVDAPLARVRVGPFADRRAAAAKLREIEARGHQPFITDERD
jgi:cell division septation protein DedD